MLLMCDLLILLWKHDFNNHQESGNNIEAQYNLWRKITKWLEQTFAMFNGKDFWKQADCVYQIN